MRFLKTLTLNRRAIYDPRASVTTGNSFKLDSIDNLVLPKSNDSLTSSQTEGMMRYNTTTHEVEVYQGTGGSATWRAIRYKESTGITQQSLGNIDGYTYFYGPLNPAPPTVVQTGSGSQTGQYSINVSWGGQNLIVLIGNVFQIFNTNYVITQNPVATKATTAQANNGTTTITVSSTATIPQGSIVTGSAYLQTGTVATVTSATSITLSKAISGGNIASGTTLTFTAASGYYLNFTSDPYYSGVIGSPVTVLIGFDQ